MADDMPDDQMPVPEALLERITRMVLARVDQSRRSHGLRRVAVSNLDATTTGMGVRIVVPGESQPGTTTKYPVLSPVQPGVAPATELLAMEFNNALVILGQVGAPVNIIPAGCCLPFAGAEAGVPAGWLLCVGQAVSRTVYAALFAALGTGFGVGDGSTTFNLPDLRGRMPLGKDNMGGAAANRVTATQAANRGQAAGEELHHLTVNELPPHTHPLPIGSGSGPKFSLQAGGQGDDNVNYYAGNNGGDQSHNNMPPYLTMNYIIKT